MKNASRFNQGKAQLSLLMSAPSALLGLTAVLEYGAGKYGRDNWKGGLNLDETIDSLLRHLLQLKSGTIVDDESGLPHVDHILANALFLSEQHRDKGDDNG